jgi:hypothetical protein
VAGRRLNFVNDAIIQTWVVVLPIKRTIES